MVESSSDARSKERNVYYYTNAIEIKDYKVSAIDAYGNLSKS